ncbi:hypothetical protein ACTUQZ_14940, partial [Listeria monocytogenes]
MKRLVPRVLVLLLAKACAAPLPAAAPPESTAASPAAGVRRIADLPYGPDPRQRMDVYLPASAEAAPVLVMVHGGAWMFGDKAAASVV